MELEKIDDKANLAIQENKELGFINNKFIQNIQQNLTPLINTDNITVPFEKYLAELSNGTKVGNIVAIYE